MPHLRSANPLGPNLQIGTVLAAFMKSYGDINVLGMRQDAASTLSNPLGPNLQIGTVLARPVIPVFLYAPYFFLIAWKASSQMAQVRSRSSSVCAVETNQL